MTPHEHRSGPVMRDEALRDHLVGKHDWHRLATILGPLTYGRRLYLHMQEHRKNRLVVVS